MIHETAIVDESAHLGVDVRIGPYSLVEAGTVVGDRCVLEAHSLVRRGVELGEDCLIHPFAVVGDDPQMNGFDRSLESGVRVGSGSTIRESVTIHRSAYEGKSTVVGHNAMLMVGCHIGHDCEIGDDVTLANAALLAGHVTLGDHVFVGGGAGIHQFVRVGESAMIGGGAEISLDVPPFLIAAERNTAAGPNLVGLRRREFEAETIAEIKGLYREVCQGVENPRKAAKALVEGEGASTEEGLRFLTFFADGQRSFVRSRSSLKSDSDL